MSENDAIAKKFGGMLGSIISESSRSNVNAIIMLLDMLIDNQVLPPLKVKEYLEQRIEKLQTIDTSAFEDKDKLELELTLSSTKRIYDELFE